MLAGKWGEIGSQVVAQAKAGQPWYCEVLCGKITDSLYCIFIAEAGFKMDIIQGK